MLQERPGRRNRIIRRLGRIEERLADVTLKAHRICLQNYISSLESVDLKDYDQKDAEMTDCSICLICFEASEKITVFPCDPKHYFHKKCAEDWLAIKSECPLCRHDLTEQINEFIRTRDDIFNEVAR